MNWEAASAVGELLGSIAVIVTLLYLVRQLKGAEVATLNSTQSTIQMARLTVNNQRFDHLELLLRANSGAEQNDLERAQLNILFENESATMFFTYLNFRRLGMDGSTQAYNFARFLKQHPSMHDVWRAQNDEWPPLNTLVAEWRKQVEEHLPVVSDEKNHF